MGGIVEDEIVAKMKDRECTDEVDFDLSIADAELLPIRRCICGAEFGYWQHTIGMDRQGAYACPKCGRRFYWTAKVRIYEVVGS